MLSITSSDTAPPFKNLKNVFNNVPIAHALMEKADNISQELNTVGLRLYVNTGNSGGIAFYENCGYEQQFGTSMLMQKDF